MKQTEFRDRALVVESNPLVRARRSMTTLQAKIFAIGLADVNPHMSVNDKTYDIQFRDTYVPASKVREMFGADGGWYLSKMREACKKLGHTVIEFDYKDGGISVESVFNHVRYLPGDGLYIRFNDDMKPYILELVGQKYTRIPTKEIFALSSTYAMRLLEVLMQERWAAMKKKKHVAHVKIGYADLRGYLNVPEETYTQMSNFRKFVLDAPIKEIHKKTCYRIEYQTIKTGRKVTAFDFSIDFSKESLLDVNETLDIREKALNFAKPEIQEALEKAGATPRTAKSWCKRFPENALWWLIKKMKTAKPADAGQWRGAACRNGGWLMSAYEKERQEHHNARKKMENTAEFVIEEIAEDAVPDVFDETKDIERAKIQVVKSALEQGRLDGTAKSILIAYKMQPKEFVKRYMHD